MVSVIIPVYNEKKTIDECLFSLSRQTYRDLEILVVDDGSTDNTAARIKNLKLKTNKNFKYLNQTHQGPGIARNYAASFAKGEILVFVDADMTFEPDFIKDLVKPIEIGKTIGTFSHEEYLLNNKNSLAVCYNINRYFINGWKLNKEVYERILPTYYPNHQQVFRAIKKNVFMKAEGFQNTGYNDDWSIAKKLNKEAVSVKGAIYYHRNPQTLLEIYSQALWIGKNEFLTGNLLRKIYNLFRYSVFFSFFAGVYLSLKYSRLDIIIVKLVYDLGIWGSVIKSFFSDKKLK